MSLWHPTKPAYPIADNAYDLGSPTLRWRYVFPIYIRTRDSSAYSVDFESHDDTAYRLAARLMGGLFSIPRSGSITPVSDNTYYLGTAAMRWASVYPVSIRTKDTSTDTVNFESYDGSTYRVAAQLVGGYFTIPRSGHITPVADNTYNLGSSTSMWANIYMKGTLTINDTNLYRSAADVLKTDDNFDARALRIGGTEVISSGRLLLNIIGVVANLIPYMDNTYDLGSPDSSWRTIYPINISTKNTASDTVDFKTHDGTTYQTAAQLIAGRLDIPRAGTITPVSDNTYNLGSTTLRWKYIYPVAIRTRDASAYSVDFEAHDGTAYRTAAQLIAGLFVIPRSGTITPATDNTYNLGSSSLRWAYFYAVNKNASFKHPLHNPERHIVFTCVESPKVTVEDWGVAQLKDGKTFVGFSEEFVALMSDKAEYAVFLQPEGECNGLYVSKKEFYGFEVKELNNGKSNIRFSWNVKAIRIGDEDKPVLEEPTPKFTDISQQLEWEKQRGEELKKKEEDRLKRMAEKIKKYRQATSK